MDDVADPADAPLPDDQPGGRAGVGLHVRDVDPLAAQHRDDPGAQLVAADPPQPGHGVPQPGESDGGGELGAGDVETYVGVVAETVGGDDTERLSKREDLGHIRIFRAMRNAHLPLMAESMAETNVTHNDMTTSASHAAWPPWSLTSP